MTDPLERRSPLSDLLEEGARHPDPASARALFLERVDERLSARERRVPWTWALAPAALAAAAVALFYFWPGRMLEYEVRSAKADGGYVRAIDRPAQIEFSDGTEIVAAAGSRLRVEGVSAHGARVSVESGSIRTHVVHERDTDWTFLAGPFQVRVTGTRFGLDWDAGREKLVVVLEQGSVEIDGFGQGRPVSVVAGQRFVGDARERSLTVADASAAPADGARAPAAGKGEGEGDPVSTGTTTPALPSPADPADPASLGVKAQSGQRGPSWSELMKQAAFAEVVQQAEARGLSTCLASCSSADLTALADAARYTGRGALSESALLSLRKRFGTSGGRSAFMLGRLHEAEGRRTEARVWYERSLAEAPAGPFASEARAGKNRTTAAPPGAPKR